MNYIDPVFSAICQIILAGGGGALIGFLMIRAFAKGWLDSYFQTRSAKLKNDQDTALAELKRVHDAALKEVQAYIDKDLHRARKLYDREFDVLSEAWTLLVKAFDVARGTVATFVPQIDRMTEDERIRVYQHDELTHWEIDRIQKLTGHEMLDEYTKIMAHRQLVQARQFRQDLARCIVLNGLFMPAGFKERFEAIDQIITAVLVEFEVRISYPMIAQTKELERLTGEGETSLIALESMIRARVWSGAMRAEPPDNASSGE